MRASSSIARSAEGLAPLDVGTECFALVMEPIGKNGRMQVVDAARVRVLEAHVDGRYNVHRAVIVRAARARIGLELELDRSELYPVADRAEHAAFAHVVRVVWGRS